MMKEPALSLRLRSYLVLSSCDTVRQEDSRILSLCFPGAPCNVKKALPGSLGAGVALALPRTPWAECSGVPSPQDASLKC